MRNDLHNASLPLADLVICIPTYNRTRELSCLLDTCIFPLIEQYNSRVHVLISDNSDPADQDINLFNIGDSSHITYSPNSTNLGYGGNILALLELAKPLGRYLWFLSDDDDIDLRMFHSFMSLLSNNTVNNVSLYVFCYSLKSLAKDTLGSFRQSPFSPRYTTFDRVIRESQKVIPFLLISSFALDGNCITAEVLRSMRDHANDFAHISLLGISLEANSIVCVSGISPIIYNDVDGYPGIKLNSVFWGYTQAISSFSFLSAKDKYRLNTTFLRGLLYQVLRYKDDLNPKVKSCYSPFSSSYRKLVMYLFKYLTIRGLLLSLAAYTPAWITKILFQLNNTRNKLFY